MSSTLTLSTTHLTVGEPLRLRLSIKAPPSSKIRLSNPPSTPLLEKKSESAWRFARSGENWTISRNETWVSFSPGSRTKLRYGLQVDSAAGGRFGRLESPPVNVESVLPGNEASPAPAPLAAPRSLPYFPPAAAAGIAATLIAVVLLFRFVRARRAVGREPRSPDDVLESEIAMIDTEIRRTGASDAVYDWIAEITRWYIEQTAGIPASRLTSREIGDALRRDRRGLPDEDVSRVLAACDEFRFARRLHERERAAEATGSLRAAARALRTALSPTPEPGERESA